MSLVLLLQGCEMVVTNWLVDKESLTGVDTTENALYSAAPPAAVRRQHSGDVWCDGRPLEDAPLEAQLCCRSGLVCDVGDCLCLVEGRPLASWEQLQQCILPCVALLF